MVVNGWRDRDMRTIRLTSRWIDAEYRQTFKWKTNRLLKIVQNQSVEVTQHSLCKTDRQTDRVFFSARRLERDGHAFVLRGSLFSWGGAVQ